METGFEKGLPFGKILGNRGRRREIGVENERKISWGRQ
jgi:hypothetical protein